MNGIVDLLPDPVRLKRAPETGKTYFIRTHGCQMNEHDSERIAGLLEQNGYTQAAAAEQADLVLFNTCAIRENADKKLYGSLGALKAVKDQRPGMQIAVGGCQVQKDKGLLLEKAPWVDVAFGTFSIDKLPQLLAAREETGRTQFEFAEQTDVFPSALPARRAQPFHAWVSVSIGCDNACSFCIVPHVRGKQASRRLGDILDEVKRAVDDGVVEVSLLGQNVNTYGRDLDGRPMFADLLGAMDDIEGLQRVRFTSPHPRDFTEDVIKVMASSRTVCEHIHFPMQSGSDDVLARMRRSYRIERYLSWLERLRASIDGLAVTTDIIVGFPGETEEEFQQTLSAVERARFDGAFTFQYSARPFTDAGTYPDQVDPDVIKERYARLVSLQEQISLERNEAQVGLVHDVLVEGPSKKDPGRVTARTRTNKIVHVDGTFDAGTSLDARISRAYPHHLDGVRV